MKAIQGVLTCPNDRETKQEICKLFKNSHLLFHDEYYSCHS